MMMDHNKFVQFDFHWINQLPLLSRRLPLLSRKGKLSGIWRKESQKVASSEQLGGQAQIEELIWLPFCQKMSNKPFFACTEKEFALELWGLIF